METFETLWDYCASNNRATPQPQKWNELFQMLKNTRRNSSGGWIPALPLILAAWHDSPALFKQLRLKEHIQWAADNEQIEEVGKYLRSLNETDWFHFGED